MSDCYFSQWSISLKSYNTRSQIWNHVKQDLKSLMTQRIQEAEICTTLSSNPKQYVPNYLYANSKKRWKVTDIYPLIYLCSFTSDKNIKL